MHMRGSRTGLATYATARRDYDEMLDSARASGDRPSEMEALYSLGFIHGIDNDYDLARSAYRESSDIARELGDRLGEASAIFGVAFTDWLDGRFLEARDGVEVTLRSFGSLAMTTRITTRSACSAAPTSR